LLAEAGFGSTESNMESFGTFHDAIQGALSSFQGSEGMVTSGYHQPGSPSEGGITTIQGSYAMFPRDEKPDLYHSDSHETSPSPTETKFSATLQPPFATDMGFHQGYSHTNPQGQFASLIDNQDFFPKHSTAYGQGYGQPSMTYHDQKDIFTPPARVTTSAFGDTRSTSYSTGAGFYQNRMGSPEGNFNFPFQGQPHIGYHGNFDIHIARQPYPRNFSLTIGGPLPPEMELAKYHMQSPTTPSTPTSTRSSPLGDMSVDAMPPTKQKENLLCAVCGDNAACQHYGVRTCEGKLQQNTIH
jgi:hypothetical protein